MREWQFSGFCTRFLIIVAVILWNEYNKSNLLYSYAPLWTLKCLFGAMPVCIRSVFDALIHILECVRLAQTNIFLARCGKYLFFEGVNSKKRNSPIHIQHTKDLYTTNRLIILSNILQGRYLYLNITLYNSFGRSIFRDQFRD